METNDAGRQKTVVEYLNFGAKTAKRVAWEDWEFTVVAPFEVEVTNASYGFLKDEHSYRVLVADDGGAAFPLECACPADQYSDEYDCKHKVALAAVGGPTVLEAARNYEVSPERVKADGGCECDADDLPCFECYRTGRRNLPE